MPIRREALSRPAEDARRKVMVAFCVVHRVIYNIRGYLRSCVALHPADFRSWLIIFDLTADGTAPMASDARWVSGSAAAFGFGCRPGV
jgi:hypothetical protein